MLLSTSKSASFLSVFLTIAILATTFASVSFLPPIPKAQADITSGFVAHWTFDGTLSDSAGSNHGTFSGGSPSYTTGKLNQALSFDGLDDEVDIPDYNPNGADFSIGGWVTIASTGSHFQPIAGNSQNTPLLGYRPSTDQIVTFIQDAQVQVRIAALIPPTVQAQSATDQRCHHRHGAVHRKRLYVCHLNL